MNGTFFKKNGSFTGGLGTNRKIDSQRYDQLVLEKKEILHKLSEHNYSNSIQAQLDIKELEHEKSVNDGQLSRYQKYKRLSVSQREETDKSLNESQSEKDRILEILNKLKEDECTLHEKTMSQNEKYETEIKAIKKEEFADFCKRNNLKNIEEYEESIK